MSDMIFYFKAEGDRLSLIDVKGSAVTGNINSYTCRFELGNDYDGLTAFAVFSCGDNAYTCALSEQNTCVIPYEALKDTGDFYVGLFAANGSESSPKRISTGCVQIPVNQGAYQAGSAPKTPSPDVWETLVCKTIPKIGENGNWYIWDSAAKEYVDTKRPSIAEADAALDADSENPVQNKAVTNVMAQKENISNKVTGLSVISTDEEYPSAKAVWEVVDYLRNKIADCEKTSNKVTTITDASTDSQYPSAQAVYTELTKLSADVLFKYNNLNGRKEDIHELEIYNSASMDIPYLLSYRDCRFTNPLTGLTLSGVRDDIDSYLSFTSGETPTSLTYPASTIKWVGVDCDADGDFIPSANTNYEISVRTVNKDSSGKAIIVARVGVY